MRICNLWTGSPTKFVDLQFAICSAIKKNLWICDCGLSPKICEFKKKLHGNPLANLPLVSTVVHLELRYFRKFLNKIEPPLIGYSGAWGKLIYEKNMKSKIS